jgi:hypothetical protein
MPTNTKGATIQQARIAAAHDGEAELIVRISYDSGGTSEVTLDHMASAALMESCQAETLKDLEGHGWEKIREALQVSYNRFQ